MHQIRQRSRTNPEKQLEVCRELIAAGMYCCVRKEGIEELPKNCAWVTCPIANEKAVFQTKDSRSWKDLQKLTRNPVNPVNPVNLVNLVNWLVNLRKSLLYGIPEQSNVTDVTSGSLCPDHDWYVSSTPSLFVHNWPTSNDHFKLCSHHRFPTTTSSWTALTPDATPVSLPLLSAAVEELHGPFPRRDIGYWASTPMLTRGSSPQFTGFTRFTKFPRNGALPGSGFFWIICRSRITLPPVEDTCFQNAATPIPYMVQANVAKHWSTGASLHDYGME
ncbi:hypothetical protein K438DRAFT_1767092 [Mycena galopus ATCC 62051]|nr:hypothetical protein K438DRAFT_1767092 [Mycena galopus ATCC 62051]